MISGNFTSANLHENVKLPSEEAFIYLIFTSTKVLDQAPRGKPLLKPSHVKVMSDGSKGYCAYKGTQAAVLAEELPCKRHGPLCCVCTVQSLHTCCLDVNCELADVFHPT